MTEINTTQLADQLVEPVPQLSWMQRFLVNVVKTGKIPKSVAIIMDGNRRYATAHNQEKHEGHAIGLKKLEEALIWCKALGIFELTVFALSKENLKRAPIEVETLMNLCKVQFARMARNGGIFQTEKIRIRVLGDLSLLPVEVMESLRRSEELTKDNDEGVLNVCICYNSRDEIAEALASCAPGDKASFEKHLYGGYNIQPQVLIRTSNEVRLSNFMMYQTNRSYYAFVKQNWPEFSLWQFLKIIFDYQSVVDMV